MDSNGGGSDAYSIKVDGVKDYGGLHIIMWLSCSFVFYYVV